MKAFQIRQCINSTCGMRYPIIEGQSDGMRCPACLGETIEVLNQELREEADVKDTRQHLGLSVVLDNVRSAWNVGSILRSADGCGFSHVFLCGISASPNKPEVRKTALGAESSISWSSHPDGQALTSRLKSSGFHILALETGTKFRPLSAWKPGRIEAEKLVIAVGSEVSGLDPGILELADEVISLAMRGQKRSFNAAVAFAIAAYQISDRLNDQSGE